MSQETFPLPIHDRISTLEEGGILRPHISTIDSNFIIKEFMVPMKVEEMDQVEHDLKFQYKKLKESFGDMIPDAAFLRTVDNIKISQERIFGEEINKEILNANPKLKDQLTKFYEQAIDYYISTYSPEKDLGIAIDTNIYNFMIGKKSEEDQELGLYFVDSYKPFTALPLSTHLRYFQSEIDNLGISSKRLQKDLRGLNKMLKDNPQKY